MLNKADTISFGDTLFLARTETGVPLYYFQNILTGVCFDSKCRRLSINVLWNITGRYLGFQLPHGEFLSKTDHEPFSPAEYERLHGLLANPELPFSSISYDELMENTNPNDPEVDGISGATSKEVSEIVVKGAAYTTYKLWKIVYGPTRELIMDLTAQKLSPELIEHILKSPDQTDKVWVLEQIDEQTPLTPTLIETITNLLAGEDFYLAYSAISAIKNSHLVSEQLQIRMFAQYEKAVPGIRSLMIKKLMDAPYLSSEVVNLSASFLDKVNGKELGDFLKLYLTHKVKNKEVLAEVTKLRDHENAFIANQAQRFIEESEKY